MDQIREEYLILFRGVTQTIHSLEGTIRQLKALQQAAEAAYLEGYSDDETDEDLTEAAV